MDSGDGALWSDEDFLDYVYYHATTPRALFHRSHVIRLLNLAARPGVNLQTLPEWMSMHADTAHPLVAQARKRTEQRNEA